MMTSTEEQIISRSVFEGSEKPPIVIIDSIRLRHSRGEENLLYLVRYGKVLKFGRGNAHRVGAHVELGAVPVLVLTAASQEVTVARDRLKRLHRTEMVSLRTPVDLFSVLPDGLDVTDGVGGT